MALQKLLQKFFKPKSSKPNMPSEFEALPFGFFKLNKQCQVIECNQMFCKIMGLGKEDIIGTNFADLQPIQIHLSSHSKNNQIIPSSLKFHTKKSPIFKWPESGMYILQNHNGKSFDTWLVNSNGTSIETEECSFFLLSLTEHPDWQTLRVSQVHLKRFFDKSPIGIAFVSVDGDILEANNAFIKYFNKINVLIEKAKFLDLIHEKYHEKVKAYFNKVLDKGRIRKPIECKLISESEHDDIIVDLYANRIIENDDVTGLIIQFIDRTDQKNLELRFAQSQKMQAIGQLAGGIAHDFNNLLTAMIGFCDLLLVRHKPGDVSFADVMQIKQNANRAASLVRQLLAFSRKQTLSTKPINITDIIAEISHLLRRLLGVNIDLKINYGRDLAVIKADPIQLEQVIINLAVNARDAMPEGGTLTISTKNIIKTDPSYKKYKMMPEADYVLMEVEDTGIGIPKENIDRILEPFFSTKEVGSGTGLGLSTVYGIVKQSEGFLFIDSKVGVGTKFEIYFPQYQPSETEINQLAKNKSDQEDEIIDLTGKGTILFVEDEDAVRTVSTRALENKGYKVVAFENAMKALDYYKEVKKVDLLITDVVMPEMDGPTLIKEIFEINSNQKVICISGFAKDAFEKDIGQYEDIDFLAKPFSLKQLAAAVKETLEK